MCGDSKGCWMLYRYIELSLKVGEKGRNRIKRKRKGNREERDSLSLSSFLAVSIVTDVGCTRTYETQSDGCDRVYLHKVCLHWSVKSLCNAYSIFFGLFLVLTRFFSSNDLHFSLFRVDFLEGFHLRWVGENVCDTDMGFFVA